MSRTLSASAPEFIPNTANIQIFPKPKKTKDQRSCPRKRRKNKSKDLERSNIVDDLEENDQYYIDHDDNNSTQTNISQSTTSTTMSKYVARLIERSEPRINENNIIPDDQNAFDNRDMLRTHQYVDKEGWHVWFNELMLTNVDDRFSQSSMKADDFDILVNTSPSPNQRDLHIEEEWIEMQNRWSVSKNIIFDEDLQNELIERKKWSSWAIQAAELERQRRIKILKDIDDSNELERKARIAWANKAIETEQKERVYYQFLMSLTSTNWFNDAISSTIVTTDYELVCPYYKLGCTTICHRSTVEKHLQECPYALDARPSSNIETVMVHDVVCPNSVLGCDFVGGRNDVIEHLQSCSFSHGKSKEKEQEERLQIRHNVILECEEERLRRLSTLSLSTGKDNSESYVHPVGNVHNLLRSQIEQVLHQLHDNIEAYYQNIYSLQKQQQNILHSILISLQDYVNRLWSSTTIEVYGSYGTQLQGLHSDIDLVICFSDEFESLSKISGSFPLLHILANFLQREAHEFLTITNVILTARVPVIKATARIRLPDTETGLIAEHNVAVDISIDSPAHSGIATAEMVRTLARALPPLRPIVMVLKEYLRSCDLTDTYHGGISSYGIILLAVKSILKRVDPSLQSSNKDSEHVNTVENFTINSLSPQQSPNRRRSFTIESENQLSSSLLATNVLNPSTLISQGPRNVESSAQSTLSSQSNNILTRSISEGGRNKFDRESITHARSRNSNMDHLEHFYKCDCRGQQTLLNAARCNDTVALNPPSPIYQSSSRHVHESHNKSEYHWENISRQKEYGHQVALRILGLTQRNHRDLRLSIDSTGFYTENDEPNSPDLRRSSNIVSAADVKLICDPLKASSTVIELIPLTRPILGEIMEDFLNEYGEEMQCGMHGYSVRNGGFRFDVKAKDDTSTTSVVCHPQASDPIIIEDPINVINNIGAGCYKILAIQRTLLEAHERLKGVAVRCNSPRNLSAVFPQPVNEYDDIVKESQLALNEPRSNESSRSQSIEKSTVSSRYQTFSRRSSLINSDDSLSKSTKSTHDSPSGSISPVNTTVDTNANKSLLSPHSNSFFQRYNADDLLQEIFRI